MPLRLAVLASGAGSLFDAMIKQLLPIHLMVADRNCPALKFAEAGDIRYKVLPRSFGKDFDRVAYTLEMLALLRAYGIDLVAMAGFMTVFSAEMFEPGAYQGKILNTHPSLLPAFKGDHAVRDALQFGVKVTGCTIHWATKDLDAGPIVTQEAVKVVPGDTVESLHERIKAVERELYPLILRELIR